MGWRQLTVVDYLNIHVKEVLIIVYSKLLYKIAQDFLDSHYIEPDQ